MEYLLSQWRKHLEVESDSEIEPSPSASFSPTALSWVGAGIWWADYADPDNYLRVDVQLDVPVWKNQEYEHLMERARQITDQSQGMQLYQQANRILMAEGVIVPLYYEQSTCCSSRG